MATYNDIYYENDMNQAFQPMYMNVHYYARQSSSLHRACDVCGSKAIGMNFGVLTCAPCKAFFRRNARRKELLELPCRHREFSALMRNSMDFNERNMRYLQIRRCSSCRLRRCFDMGMKEDLVRTNEENERYRELVDINRRQRDILTKQLQELRELSIPRNIVNNIDLSEEIDWRHLSNIVYAYDSCCIKTFVQRRAAVDVSTTSQTSVTQSINKHTTNVTMSIVLAVSAFLKALPAYYSLPRVARKYLCKTNIRPLIFPNLYELNQSCFSEPWQIAADKASWQSICGPHLYVQFRQAEVLAEQFWITDPIVTRLFVIILFFSSPLHYHDDCPTPTPILKKNLPVHQVQNAYTTLLWKYLVHRHGNDESVRIFSHLIYVYMNMQTVGFGMYTHLRTQKDLIPTNETLNKLVTLDINDVS